MRLIKHLFGVLTVALLSLNTAEAQEKHLFILSGQSNMSWLDPETFTTTVSSFFGAEDVIVVKYAIGGKPIRCWFDDWVSQSFDNSKKDLPNIYNPLLEKTKEAIGNTAINTITFVWMQGERDAREKRGDEYQKNLVRVYNQLTRDLGRNDINMVVGRLSDHDLQNEKYPDWTKIREIQVNLANSNPRFGWIDTDDLNDGFNNKGDKISNDLHMSVSGYKLMGIRFAEKAITLIQHR